MNKESLQIYCHINGYLSGCISLQCYGGRDYCITFLNVEASGHPRSEPTYEEICRPLAEEGWIKELTPDLDEDLCLSFQAQCTNPAVEFRCSEVRRFSGSLEAFDSIKRIVEAWQRSFGAVLESEVSFDNWSISVSSRRSKL